MSAEGTQPGGVHAQKKFGGKRGNNNGRAKNSEKGGTDAGGAGYAAPGGDIKCLIREHVLQLRKTRYQSVAETIAQRLGNLLLEAEKADLSIDGPLIGMAAADCARLNQHVLLGQVCAYSTCRLSSFGGRELAEVATAAVKLGEIEGGFLRAVASYCASAQKSNFRSMRDIAMAALVLLQSVKASTTTVDHALAFEGLAWVAMPFLSDTSAHPRDAVEFAHALAHSLGVQALESGQKLHEFDIVEKALCAAIRHVRSNITRISARDAAMAAGVVAAAWPFLERHRKDILRPCLVDIAQAARWRGDSFNLHDIALMAAAFAKAEQADDTFLGALNEKVTGSVNRLSNCDLCFILWAASRVPGWAKEPFAVATLKDVQQRDLSTFSAQDLCTLVKSLVRLGSVGHTLVSGIADEAFRRHLVKFEARDKASLLWAVAKVQLWNSQMPLCRLLVRSLAALDCPVFDRETSCATLWALAQVWSSLQVEDASHKLFAERLVSAAPWKGANPYELVDAILALPPLPLEPERRVSAWESLLAELQNVAANRFSIRELCRLLTGLAPSCYEVGAVEATMKPTTLSLVERLSSELVLRLQSGQDAPADLEIRNLGKAFKRADWPVPAGLAALPEFVSKGGPDECCCNTKESANCPDTGGTADDDDVEDGSETKIAAAVQVTATTAIPVSKVTIEPIQTCDSPDIYCTMKERKLAPPGLASKLEETVLEKISLCGTCPEIQDQDHGHGGHGHVHVHGHAHGHGHDSYGIGHDSYGHGAHGDCDETCLGHGSGSPLHQPTCADHSCCLPLESPEEMAGNTRLNSHCSFRGHCVQMRNTFLHIPCQDVDSDSDGDCVVCKYTRSRSWDGTARRSRSLSDFVSKAAE